MKLSILIATYGSEDWEKLARRRALRSVINFTCEEILVGHDPNGTIASARNELAAKAKGDWLCFLDADDELAPGFVEAIERASEREGGGSLLLTPAVQQIRRGKSRRAFFFPECSFETGNWLIIGTVVPAALHRKIGGFREHPHGLEDWNYWARCVRAGARIVKVPKAIYVAHYNEESKHHVLQRDHPEYMKAYEIARADVLA